MSLRPPCCRAAGPRCALPRSRPTSGSRLTALLLLPMLFAASPPSVALTDASYRSAQEWTWPLRPQPDVVNVFDPPDGPYSAGHRGADLLGLAGQPVVAVDDGTVAYSGRVGGIGVVSIDTSAGRVTYQPVLPLARRGQDVAAGDTLGRLTSTGGHCLPQVCLHLGLIVAGEYRDPLAMLGGGAVRLLPVDGPLGPPLGTSAPPGSAVGRPATLAAGGDPLAVMAGLRLGRRLALDAR